jgi:hypothetical protein
MKRDPLEQSMANGKKPRNSVQLLKLVILMVAMITSIVLMVDERNFWAGVSVLVAGVASVIIIRYGLEERGHWME